MQTKKIKKEKKNTKKKLFAAVSAVLLSGSFLFSSGTPRVDVYAASTQEQLQNAKAQKAAAQEKIAAAQAQVNALSGEVGELSSELAGLSSLNEEQKKQYAKIAGQMQLALQEQQNAFNMYMESLENLEQQQLEYSQRMGVLLEYKNKSVIEVLLSSDDLASFFTQMEMIELIGEADQQALDRLGAAIDDAELKREYAEDQAIAMQIVIDEKQAELDALRNQMDITQANLSEKQWELSSWEQKENDLETESANLEQTIRDLQAKAAEEQAAAAAAAAAAQHNSSGGSAPSVRTGSTSGSNGGGSVGGLTWPVPGRTGTNSAYGMRIHPISGVRKMHTGEDIGASYGDNIVAAKDGRVIVASAPVSGQNTGGSGYGNYIVIDHGDGVSTLYGHCRSLYVGLGDTVSAGQLIAEVGSTGSSTGPHLHFEVRINGSHTNPNNYF